MYEVRWARATPVKFPIDAYEVKAPGSEVWKPATRAEVAEVTRDNIVLWNPEQEPAGHRQE